MDSAYATFGGLAAPWLYCSFQDAQGFDLIKGFVSWEWEQGGRKEGRSEGGGGGKTNGTEEGG